MNKNLCAKAVCALAVVAGAGAAQAVSRSGGAATFSRMGSVKRAVRLLERANGQLEVIEVETAAASEAVAALYAEFVQSGDADAVTAKLANVRQRVGELSNDIEEAAANASKARRILNSVVSPTSTQVDPALAAALQEAFAMLEEVEARIEEAREGIAAVVQAIQDLQKAMN